MEEKNRNAKRNERLRGKEDDKTARKRTSVPDSIDFTQMHDIVVLVEKMGLDLECF